MQIPQETKGTLVPHWWFLVIGLHCNIQKRTLETDGQSLDKSLQGTLQASPKCALNRPSGFPDPTSFVISAAFLETVFGLHCHAWVDAMPPFRPQ